MECRGPHAALEVVVKSMMLVVSIAFVLNSCATSGREPELTKQPEFPALEEAMGTIVIR